MDVPADEAKAPVNVEKLVNNSLDSIFNPDNSPKIYHEWSAPFSISSLDTIPESLLNRLKNEPCIAGIDEAGRGPVLGPLVYGICVAPISIDPKVERILPNTPTQSAGFGQGGISTLLKDSGYKDSKKTTHLERVHLFHCLNKTESSLPNLPGFKPEKQKCYKSSIPAAWGVNIMSPSFLSQKMLSHQPTNLNMLSHASAMSLISMLISHGINLKECYVDTVGTPETYESLLTSSFPGIVFKVRKKADSLFPMVSAASIAAKVCRDYVLQTWKYIEPGWKDKIHWSVGSGYPGHEQTIAYMKKTQHKIFGLPSIVRYSWKTTTNALKAQTILGGWPSDPASMETSQILSIRQKRHRNLNIPSIHDVEGDNNHDNVKEANSLASTQPTQHLGPDQSQGTPPPFKKKKKNRVFLSHHSREIGIFTSPPVDYYLWENCHSV